MIWPENKHYLKEVITAVLVSGSGERFLNRKRV